jgi:tRNA A-37 threonylcarbamoyl transferase component Bud32
VPSVISVGSRVGGYTVIRLLGQGGMGQVYLAEHQRISRRVAVKVLLPELSANESLIERFFTEARATSLIRHPGIVEVLDCDVLDNQAYIVMEFLEGESLAGYLTRVGSLAGDLGFALAVVGQVADAVGAAHASDIVHRDLKPDNIFLCASTRNARVIPKVLDFGIAKLAVQGTPTSGQTRTGMLMGTPAYMSPEQCRGGSKTVDGRSDVYSMGCIFYEILCGQPPFVRDGAGELIVAHVAETPEDPCQLIPGLPPAIGALVMRMLAKNVQDRPPTMSAVATEIAHCLAARGETRALADIHPRAPVLVPASPGGVPQSAVPTPRADAMAATATPNPAGALSARGAPRPSAAAGPPSAADNDGIVVPTTLAGASGQQATLAPQDLARRSPARWAIPAVLAAGGALAIVLLMSRARPAASAGEGNAAPGPSAAPTAAPAPPSPAMPSPAPPVAPSPAAPRDVTIEVRGLPTGGGLLLDGAPVTGSSLKLRRGDWRHVLIARAEGYYDRTIEVESDRDQTVDLVLTAMAKSAKPDKPHGHESGGSGHHAAAAHGAAAPTASKTTEPTTTPKPPQGGQKKTNYDEM